MLFRSEIENNRRIVESMDIKVVGKDKDARHRWAYVHNGIRYYFDNPSYWDIRIRSMLTNRTRYASVAEDYRVGNWRYLGSFHLPNVMLNVYHGHIKLSF